MLATGTLWKWLREVWVLQHRAEHRFVDPSVRGQRPIAIHRSSAIRARADEGIQQHVSGPGIVGVGGLRALLSAARVTLAMPPMLIAMRSSAGSPKSNAST